MRQLTLTIISDDAVLIALCQEVLRDLGQIAKWELRVESDYDVIPSPGICLVDYIDNKPFHIPDLKNNSVKYLSLVQANQLEQFRKRYPLVQSSVLLKPVTRTVLNAYIVSIVSSSEASALRVERDDLLQGLLEANLRLQQYDKQRTNFLARVVHEFRVPLTALEGFLGLLDSGELGTLNDNQAEALRRMRHSVGIMKRSTSAMLDLSLAGVRNRELQLREGRIEDSVEQVLKLMEPVAQEKHLHVSSTGVRPPGTPMLFEPEQIEQVLINLLENACKASPAHGTIEISGYPYHWERRLPPASADLTHGRRESTPMPNSYRVDIRNSGPGIRPEHLQTMFEEYTSYSEPHHSSGGGLGLAICRSIIQRHGGEIWANTLPSGSLVSFVLPFIEEKQFGPAPQKKATA